MLCRRPKENLLSNANKYSNCNHQALSIRSQRFRALKYYAHHDHLNLGQMVLSTRVNIFHSLRITFGSAYQIYFIGCMLPDRTQSSKARTHSLTHSLHKGEFIIKPEVQVCE